MGKNKNTSSSSLGGEEIQKTNGLYNLGNSKKMYNLIQFLIACYMNSALQCLANTKFFSEYFIKEKKHLTQMNLKNKSGHAGELASNFALLVSIYFTLFLNNEPLSNLWLDVKNVVHRVGRCPQIIQSMYILNQRIVPGL
jgi:hypothetical protein